MSDNTLAAFKAYDIRGRVPDNLNEDMAYDIGRAYVAEIAPDGAVAVGHDIRLTSPDFSRAVIRGINDAGVDTVDIGEVGTEMVYFASSMDGMGGGIMVTASHNPKDYNGLKLVHGNARPISADTGLMDIERRVRTGDMPGKSSTPGKNYDRDILVDYTLKILSFMDTSVIMDKKVVANAGNGCAGRAFDEIVSDLPLTVERIHFEPDGTFPNGVPNPLLIENRDQTADVVRSCGADIGIAWDGDFDRCFFFDENGAFIEGYYVVGVLAKQMLKKYPGATVVYDPRLVWNTQAIIEEESGRGEMSKSGHSFIKEKMRGTKAVYGGEMSAHHYFRDFTYSDSGMIPWLLILEEMITSGKSLSAIVEDRIERYPCSGEINRRVGEPAEVIRNVQEHFRGEATDITTIDGISMKFGNAWRFNLRMSNTEPVVRLNVESQGDRGLMEEKTDEVLEVIGGDSAG